MSGFLVDTNVISEVLRREPNPRVLSWSKTQEKAQLFLSVIALGELRKGLTILPSSARRARLERAIAERLTGWFDDRILPVTASIGERWGVLDGQRQLAGRPLAAADGLLAATALEHDLVLVTRNVRDFEALGVQLLNPWTD